MGDEPINDGRLEALAQRGVDILDTMVFALSSFGFFVGTSLDPSRIHREFIGNSSPSG